MDPSRLWAKSKRDEDPEIDSMFLPGHLSDAYEAGQRVLAATSDDQLRALGLEPAAFRDRLWRIVSLAAAIHDLGKANDHFQGMIIGKRIVQQNPQGIRHEWVTILMLGRLKDWLLPAVAQSELDLAIVAWAVAGHHPAADHGSPPRLCPPGAGVEINLATAHNDFASALAWLGTVFSLTEAPELPDQVRSLVGSENVFEELARWHRNAMVTWNKLKRPDRLLVAGAKNCLIAADVAGSALPKAWPGDPSRWHWITDSFAATPNQQDLQTVVDLRLNGQSPRPFQVAVAASASPVTYVKAGCGTGKTVAAYMWAAKNYPTRRLYFCYPTTGTATEGFKDYLFAPEGELAKIGAKLFHSRRDVDLEIILSTGRDNPHEDAEIAARLESLEAWSTPIVACTVDTVLGIVQNNRRGVFAWPALAQSAFVFDEIHAFDDRLFGALLRLLRDVPGVPVLLMTASLPKAREEALRNTLGKLNRDLIAVAGPADLEELPRYHRATVDGNDPSELIKQTEAAGQKVLWVCNTVGRVMAAADRASTLRPLIYHSRFKYIDRVQRHKAVVEAFNPGIVPGGALAICSQVAEMSLDLSADLLVTDLATVPALIQRLGRLNRRARAGHLTKPFVVIEPDDHLPYTPPDLEAARSWLAKLPPADIQQKYLAECWEQQGDQTPALLSSAWLDGGPTTTVAELREPSLGITVLMAEDLPAVRKKFKQIGRYLLPMPPPPRRLDWWAWPRERGIIVAPSGTIHYDPMRGAQWAK